MSLIATAFFMATAAAGTPPVVVVANMDWDHLSHLQSRGRSFDGSAINARMREIIRTNQCKTPDGKAMNLRVVTIRYAALVKPDGGVLKVAVEPIGCRPVEALVGAFAISPFALDGIVPPGGTAPVWQFARLTIKS